jgi:uncharacterized membrane protein YeaQ/YmgE (transglycosylase-associated protein family)
MEQIIISLLSGAAGGNITGGLFRNLNLGVLWNSVAGLVGGGIGGQLLGMLGMAGAGGGMDVSAIIGQVVSGGLGGSALLAFVGAIRNILAK